MTKTLFGLPVRDIPHRDNLIKKFEKYVDVKEEGCWEWKGGTNGSNYGSVTIDGDHIPKSAHRKSYELFVDDIPEGLFVCHHCDNPPCIRPDHLFVGTQKDNLQDASEKGRLNISSSQRKKISQAHLRLWKNPEFRGGLVGELNPNFGKTHTAHAREVIGIKSVAAAKRARAKARQANRGIRREISTADALSIVTDTRGCRKLAKLYGVSKSYICDIKNRKTWHFRDD